MNNFKSSYEAKMMASGFKKKREREGKGLIKLPEHSSLEFLSRVLSVLSLSSKFLLLIFLILWLIYVFLLSLILWKTGVEWGTMRTCETWFYSI